MYILSSKLKQCSSFNTYSMLIFQYVISVARLEACNKQCAQVCESFFFLNNCQTLSWIETSTFIPHICHRFLTTMFAILSHFIQDHRLRNGVVHLKVNPWQWVCVFVPMLAISFRTETQTLNARTAMLSHQLHNLTKIQTQIFRIARKSNFVSENHLQLVSIQFDGICQARSF